MRTTVIAHRGASHSAPENTLAAFLKAKELGADGFETDVQLTKDGKMVMHHNYTIDANTDGSGRIIDMTLEELKTYDFGSWKGKKFKGQKILTLQECLEVAKQFRMVNIELKAPLDRTIPYVEPVAKAIGDAGMTEKVIISAFDHSLLGEMKQLLPDIRVGALTLPPLEGIPKMELVRQYLPEDVSLAEIKREDITIPEDNVINLEALGIGGKDILSAAMEQIRAIAAIYPGKSLKEVLNELQKQQNLEEYVSNLDFKLDYLHCEYHSCFKNPELIEKMHEMGVGVNPWTVDKKADLRTLLAMKPDGIITNRPKRLLKLLA